MHINVYLLSNLMHISICMGLQVSLYIYIYIYIYILIGKTQENFKGNANKCP